MKKVVLFICVALMLSFSVKNQNLESVLTSGKWYVESTQEKGSEPEKSDDKNDEWIMFYADGKLEENQFGEIFNGNWKYDANEKVIMKMEGSNVEYLKVIEVSSDKLILEQVGVDGSEGLIITYVK